MCTRKNGGKRNWEFYKRFVAFNHWSHLDFVQLNLLIYFQLFKASFNEFNSFDLWIGIQTILSTEPTNCDRRIDSFTESDCWKYFRYKKEDLSKIVRLLGLPYVIKVKGEKNGTVFGEYATLVLIDRLHYPGTLDELAKR